MKIEMTQEHSQNTQVELPIEEEAREGCCGSCSGESCCSESDCKTEDPIEMEDNSMEQTCIKHPFTEEFIPMALVKCGLDTYLCGLIDYDNDSLVAKNPLMYQEQLHPEGGVGIYMRVPIIALGCIPELVLKYAAIYLLKNSRPSDLQMAASYESNYKENRMSESGIVQPTAEDMIQIHRG